MQNTFIDRTEEQLMFKKIINSKTSGLYIVYGRRRIGKSALLRYVTEKKGIYFLADLNEKKLQIQNLAQAIASKIQDFDTVIYPSWYSLFISLEKSLSKKTTLVLDEFPYLVNNSPELASEIQKLIDLKKIPHIDLILCGSSQQMMRDLFLGITAPLYGRANQTFNIKAIKLGWIKDYLKCTSEEAIMEYATWGGVPRYWEIRKQYKTLEEAQRLAILNKNGILYEEPMRLFLDDMRTAVQAYTLVNLIGNGKHRLSEIATTVQKPATQLSRPLAQLIEMGYIRRDTSFGEPENNAKKNMYWLNDNFMNFYMQFVASNKSIVELGLWDEIKNKLAEKLPMYYAQTWEEEVRNHIPLHNYFNTKWGKASRYWGKPDKKTEIEIDAIAESIDKKSILIAEVKWSNKIKLHEIEKALDDKIALFNFKDKYKHIHKAIFIRNKKTAKLNEAYIFDCDTVVLKNNK
jgi:AAA+ ATPase superfamily predicted ATPase